MAECFFHEGRPAVTRCKQCGKPLCSECKYITENGIFCGEKCAQSFGVFAKRAEELEEKRRPEGRSKVIGFIKFILFLAIVYALYKVAMRFLR